MNSEYKFLPLSDHRVRIYKNGKIERDGSTLVPAGRFTGKVLIDWLGEKKHYLVSDLYAIVYCNVCADPKVLKEVEGFVTEEESGSSVWYRFRNGPVESNEYPGFFFIPYFTNSVISKSGEILRVKDGRKRKLNQTKQIEKKNIRGGYFGLRILSDSRDKTHSTLHRLLGLAFLRYEESPWNLVINHLDGKGENNSLDNLEWTTRALNNQHAYDTGLLPNKVTPVDYYNFFTDEKKTFPSIRALGRYIGKTESFVYDRMTRTKFVLFPDGILAKHSDGLPWPEIAGVPTGIDNAARPVISFNIDTGETIRHSSMAEASALIGLSRIMVRHYCREKKFALYNSYLFKYEDDYRPWLEFSEDQKSFLSGICKTINFFVEVTDPSTGIVERYLDLASAATVYNVAEGTVYVRSKKEIDPVTGKQFRIIRITTT